MAKWTIEYGNDTGPDDGGFWEWWEVTDGERAFKCDKEAHAQWLLRVLEPVDQPPEWLRDDLAGRAMASAMAGATLPGIDDPNPPAETTEAIAGMCRAVYRIADAMLAARVAPRE